MTTTPAPKSTPIQTANPTPTSTPPSSLTTHTSSTVTTPNSPAATTPTAAGTDPGQGGFTDPASQDAFALLSQTLQAWGLSDLVPDLKGFIVAGDTNADTLSLALSQTQAYKTRFGANAIRQQKGLPALTPAQYIATEEQYRNTLQAYGLPSGFYDSVNDFTQMIGNDISPAELDTRAKIAHDQYLNAPPEWQGLWKSYGFSQGDAIASILDPTVATQVIQDRANQVAIGGTAAQYGFNVNQGRAQQFEQNGVTLAGAQRAYSQISQTFGTDQSIASRFGQQFGQTQEENDLLLGQGAATNQRQTLYDDEKGLFKSSPGTNAQSLSVSQSY